MDVVELVPLVSFSPRTNMYGRMSVRIFPIIKHVDFYKCTEFGGEEGNFFCLTPRLSLWESICNDPTFRLPKIDTKYVYGILMPTLKGRKTRLLGLKKEK